VEIFLNVSMVFVIVVFSFVAGMLTLYAYMLYRMVRSDGWDHSNMTNAMRVLSHVVLHPEDLGKMYYLTDEQVRTISQNPSWALKRPFWYIDKDELESVVATRPDTGAHKYTFRITDGKDIEL